MSEDPTPDWAHSFGGVADAYERARPTYPPEAAQWLVGQQAATVLELGAGTGKLTEQLVALGHGIVATDPDQAMLDRLQRKLPEVSTLVAHAEELPVGDHGFDAVVAAQAFHWFDLDRALPEIARALKRGGRLGLVWNWRDDSIPWVRRLGTLIGTQEQLAEPAQSLDDSGLFGPVEEARFTHWQQVDRKSIQDLVLSRSNIAVLDEEVTADTAERFGAAALKFLLPWHPARRSQAVDLAHAFMARCRDLGLPGVLEGVVRPREDDTVSREGFAEALVTAAADLSEARPDLYKTEVIYTGDDDRDLATATAMAITERLSCPWVVLSSGVSGENFPTAAAAAVDGGASGFLAGRAVWSEATKAADPVAYLRAHAAPNLQAITDRVRAAS